MPRGLNDAKNTTNFGVGKNRSLCHDERPFVEEMFEFVTYLQILKMQAVAYGK